MNNDVTIAGFSSLDDFLDKIPKRMQAHVNDGVKAEIEAALDSDVGELYREALLTNIDLIEKFGSNPDRYARAVKFVSYLNMGKPNYEAFALTNPEKYAKYREEGLTTRELRDKLTQKGTNFKKTQLVTHMLARSMIPIAIGNMHHRQAAIDKLVELVGNAASERVQMESADKLLLHLNLDKTEFSMAPDVVQTSANIVSTLAGVLDKMVSMHQNQKEVNPHRSNSEVIEGIVLSATRGGV